MPTCKEVLNRYRWDPDREFAGLFITYRHRGAPDDEKTMPIEDVKDLGTSFIITIEDTRIPYHRVLRIADGEGDDVWIRRRDHG